MESFFKINIRDWLMTRTDDADILSRFDKINLSVREEDLFSKIFLINDSVDPLDLLNILERYTPFLRAEQYANKAILTKNQADKIRWSKEYFQNEENFGVMLRTAYEWNGSDDIIFPVRRVFNDWDEFTGGNFSFDTLDPPWNEYYSRLFLVVIVKNFGLVLNLHQIFFLNSPTLYSAISLDLDVEEAVKKAIDFFTYIENRIEVSQDLATFLYSNVTEIGANPENGEAVNINYWIDKFRLYSNHNFDGMSLIRFIEDEAIWGQNDNYDKEIIRRALSLYGHLISRQYVYPPKDELDNFVRNEKNTSPIEIRKRIESELSGSSDTEDNIAKIYSRLNDLADFYKDESIKELYYYDESSSEFKWKE